MFRLNPHFCQSVKMTMKEVNTADNARLDISARELWNSCEKTSLTYGSHILPHSLILGSP